MHGGLLLDGVAETRKLWALQAVTRKLWTPQAVKPWGRVRWAGSASLEWLNSVTVARTLREGQHPE